MITWRVCAQRRRRSSACPCFDHMFYGNNISCSKNSVYFVVENTFTFVTSRLTLIPWLCVLIFVNQILDLSLACFRLSFWCQSSFNLVADFKPILPCVLTFQTVVFFQPRDQLENFTPRLSTCHRLPFLFLFLLCRFQSFELVIVFVTLVQWPLLLLLRRMETDVFEKFAPF